MGNRWDNNEIEELKRLNNEGKSAEMIGKELNRSKASISVRLSTLGIKSKYRPSRIITTHIYNVNDIVSNQSLRIIKQTRDTKYNDKAYIVQSVKYPDAPTYMVYEHNLLKNIGCGYSSGKKVFEGNSLYSCTSIRNNIIDIEQSKTITQKTGNLILFKCGNKTCNNTRKMLPVNLIKYGFPCSTCSKGISYGELAFSAYQEYFKLGYEHEKVLKTLSNRRLDFVKFNNEGNIINFVEIQGEQHTNTEHRWYEYTHTQDTDKRKWAKENNILMIEIDMRISNWEYFKEQINKCEYLPNVNDVDEEEILKLMEKNRRYPVEEIVEMYTVDKMSSYQIADKLQLTGVIITSVLKKNGIKLRDNTKEIRLINTGEIYPSIKEASRKTGIHRGHISSNCRGKLKSAGKLKDGSKAHWEYVTEY